MYAIRASHVVREFTAGRGACGVTLAIEPGVCFGLLGRNGSGKSTLTHLLLGMDKPTGGSLQVLGCDVGNGCRSHLSRIGAVLDTSVHWEQLSGWENAFFIARCYAMRAKAIESRLTDLFQSAGLMEQAHDPVRTYSFGMRRKLSIIQALCHDPDLLVLDEPTSGLDAHFLLALKKIMENRTVRGKTSWIAGNDSDWMAGPATRVAFMEAGKICALGTVETLSREVSPFQALRVDLLRPVELSHPPFGGVHSLEQSGRSLVILMERDPALVPGVMDWIVSQGATIRSVEVNQSTLKDAFLFKTGRPLET